MKISKVLIIDNQFTYGFLFEIDFRLRSFFLNGNPQIPLGWRGNKLSLGVGSGLFRSSVAVELLVVVVIVVVVSGSTLAAAVVVAMALTVAVFVVSGAVLWRENIRIMIGFLCQFRKK